MSSFAEVLVSGEDPADLLFLDLELDGPTPTELAEIAAEEPRLAAELARLEAEIAALAGVDAPVSPPVRSEADWTWAALDLNSSSSRGRRGPRSVSRWSCRRRGVAR